ncbi:MAG TPA: Lrp/AsnC family transcriptional regulator [Amycolatopsis sp.]|uniref:Lrp/AsnC family transcriptional regulator n=1 Tax=Amycolatopsis nalaikhensis TaxID=715472 RepID=A0ABY8XNS6_9PSEU|nr:Lrp/AsnC family transcriptional regulator [Amycolatopsis sp. 2-2]WIV57289.1 Lrp/AsnC family transcriptional regulator [Amycolatopsis sp. 2-2]
MPETIDEIDARLLEALREDPRSTAVALAERLGLSRNTVQARLARLDQRGVLGSFERRIDPARLGYPLRAFVNAMVDQRRLAEVAEALSAIPEVTEVCGLTGASDLMVQVVAVDADDLYRVAGHILASPGVERTNISLVMRELVPYRLTPLLERVHSAHPET